MMTLEVEQWLRQFEQAVRTSDYALGLALHDVDAVLFGTRTNHSSLIESYVETQWKNIWPNSRGFSFTEILVLESGSHFVSAALLWKNFTMLDGVEVERNGRASYIWKISSGKLLAIHSHYSEFPVK